MGTSSDLTELSIIVVLVDIKNNLDLMVKHLGRGHSVVKPLILAEGLQGSGPLCSTTQEFRTRTQISEVYALEGCAVKSWASQLAL